MHDALDAVNDSTVAGVGRLARFFGFSDVMGRLYGTVLISPLSRCRWMSWPSS